MPVEISQISCTLLVAYTDSFPLCLLLAEFSLIRRRISGPYYWAESPLIFFSAIPKWIYATCRACSINVPATWAYGYPEPLTFSEEYSNRVISHWLSLNMTIYIYIYICGSFFGVSQESVWIIVQSSGIPDNLLMLDYYRKGPHTRRRIRALHSLPELAGIDITHWCYSAILLIEHWVRQCAAVLAAGLNYSRFLWDLKSAGDIVVQKWSTFQPTFKQIHCSQSPSGQKWTQWHC